MNAPVDPPSRAEQQALSVPFLLGDQEVLRMIARLADERERQMREIVGLGAEDNLKWHEIGDSAPEWLARFWGEHPMPLPTGFKADKRFHDGLSGDL